MKKIILSSLVASSIILASDFNYEVTPMVGYVDTKSNVDFKNHKVGGVSVARNLDNKYVNQLELGLLKSLSDADYENSTLDSSILRVFVNGVKDYKLTDKFKLYALVGLGYEDIDKERFNNDSNPFFNYGVGIKYAISKALSLKLDARHLLKTDGDQNILYTFGLAIGFGAKGQNSPVVEEPIKVEKTEPIIVAPVKQKDSDNDGVIDSKDLCPTTLPGVKVDTNGCELDDDKDGVLNSKDMCPTTQEGTKVDTNGCKMLDKPENLGVLFDTDSAIIKNSDLSKFDKYVEYLNKMPNAKIILEAHTDSIGDANYNLGLSQRRAQSVKEQLIKMGIDQSRIEATGYGESKPKVENDTNEHRQMNRRVTARIITN